MVATTAAVAASAPAPRSASALPALRPVRSPLALRADSYYGGGYGYAPSYGYGYAPVYGGGYGYAAPGYGYYGYGY
ncbi:hypothetical protein ABIE45_003254 [Methylobacterium sp. OAE515]